MSSMTKVMQMIDEQAAEAPPVVVDESTPAAPHEPDAPPADGAGVKDSRFVADAAASEPGGPPLLEPLGAADATVPWDAARVDPVLVCFHDRYAAAAEQYRSVRARLLAMNTSQSPQVLIVTSSVPEEGKSVTTLNMGLAMAESGDLRILVVDADFRRTSLARMLGVPASPGLADVLRGDATLSEAIQPTPYPNLKVMPAGSRSDAQCAGLLSGPALVSLVDELHLSFNYTFFDTPPVTTVSDVCLLAPHCDGALMVVEMRRTPEPTVQKAVRTLQASNVKIVGCLLSRFSERGAGYYERYYSSYYRR